MRVLKKSVSVLLILTMVISLFTVIPFEVGAAVKISYIDRYYNPEYEKIEETQRTCDNPTKLSSFPDMQGVTLGDGWYYVDESRTFSNRVNIFGYVYLILCDDVTLTLDEGFRVPENYQLSIYGQAADSGKLIAHSDDYKAAIGSDDEDDDEEDGAGIINIYGGNITAKAGSDAAGIGGGNEARGGWVSIYGGTVNATGGEDGAGIGSGDEYEDGNSGVVNIYGGVVNATGGRQAAGIGGGDDVKSGPINIYGGEITAKSGLAGAGIGGGEGAGAGEISISNAKINTQLGHSGGTAIGGGSGGSNDAITIRNSEVIAKMEKVYNGAWRTGAGIGAGSGKDQGGAIKIYNSTVLSQSGHGADVGDGGGAAIGGGSGGDGGYIYIENSEVYATACSGAGIGGGDGGNWISGSKGNNGTVEIVSSRVIAISACRGAGIGGGDEGDGGTVRITDSEVWAFGGSCEFMPNWLVKPAVTASVPEAWAYFAEVAMMVGSCRGAGIGGGDNGDGANVEINNSKVVVAAAQESSDAKSIGRGKDGDSDGSLTLSDNLKVSLGKVVKIKSDNENDKKDYRFDITGSVEPSRRYEAIRNNKAVMIEPCSHPYTICRPYDVTRHAWQCSDCGMFLPQTLSYHSWNSNNICVSCGASAQHSTITIKESSDSGEQAYTVDRLYATDYPVPECSSHPSGMEFAYWKVDGKEYKVPGQTITVNNNVLEAVYLPTVSVSYIDENGNKEWVQAKKFPETVPILSDGFYVVDSSIYLSEPVQIFGDVSLILADSAWLTFTDDASADFAVQNDVCSNLKLYGQENQSGTLFGGNRSFYGYNYWQYGGIVKNVKTISANNNATIAGGKLTADDVTSTSGDVTVRGGNVTVGLLSSGYDILLGWTNPTDSIKADDYAYGGRVRVLDDQELKDENGTVYSGPLHQRLHVDVIKGQTLTPEQHNYRDPWNYWDNNYASCSFIFDCKDCNFRREVKADVAITEDGKYCTSHARCEFLNQEYTASATYQVIFDITAAPAGHGTLSVKQSESREGGSIEIMYEPDDGYTTSAVYYIDDENESTAITGGRFTMPKSNVTVHAEFVKDQTVKYIDEDGSVKSVSAIPITDETAALTDGWYYVEGNLSTDRDISLGGNAKLILCDNSRLYTSYSISGSLSDTALKIYRAPGENEGYARFHSITVGTVELVGGEIELRYAVDANVLNVKGGSIKSNFLYSRSEMNVSGGSVDVYDETGPGFYCYGDLTVSGGSVHAKTDDTRTGLVAYNGNLTVTGGEVNFEGFIFSANVRISGGDVNVTKDLRASNGDVLISGGNVHIGGELFTYEDITLGWTELSDSIYASSYKFGYEDHIRIADGQILTDGTNFFTGSYDRSQSDVLFVKKTLTPVTLTERVEPYIDEDGDYKLGTVEHFELGGKNYAVNADGSVGAELSDLSLSYFDFTLNGSTYQINYYTGPVENLTLLEIPKTFNGKKITILGSNDINNLRPVIDIGNNPVKPIELKLTENIEEIAMGAFYNVLVTKVSGDTARLRTLGLSAFYYEDSTAALDITLNRTGNISTDYYTFGNRNVTAHLKHAARFSTSNTGHISLTYDFTDAHVYESPSWTWSDDYSSATAEFTCTDNRCGHKETVNSTVTIAEEREKFIYTATAKIGGNTYTDSKETARSSYEVMILVTEHGTVTADYDSAYVGDSVTLTVTPDEGYVLKSLTVKDADDNKITVTDNKFTMPASVVMVKAVFKKNVFTVTYEAAEHGTVTGTGTANVGDEVELTVTPDEDYALESLTVKDANDNEITVTDNKFTMPVSNVTVTAVFRKNVFAVTYEAIEHGSVTGVATANVGDQVELTVTPDTGYKLQTLTVKTSSDQRIEVSDGKFIMPADDVTVTAVFEQKTYDITYADTNGGWVRGAYSANFGEEISLEVIPADGYELDTLTVTDENDSAVEVSDNIFTMPDSGVTVAATFKKYDLSITYVVVDGQGTITGTATAQFNDEVPLTITPAEGYALLNLYAEYGEWDDPANIIDGALIMPDCNAIVYAEFVPITPRKEPWIDENGEYHIGNIKHCEIDGYYYEVVDGVVGNQLDSVELSYFDFTLLSDDTYRINYYTGSYDGLDELVIPKTYQGKTITVLGTGIQGKNFMYDATGDKAQFELVLNENIREIKDYAFWAMWVTEVKGNTESLSKIGDYAFSWANARGGYTLDIQLDYPGRITVGSGIFNNMTVTARIKHATTFSSTSFSAKRIDYIFTDAHTYGDPTWTWSDDNSAAAATFTCTDSRCRHQETVDATITREIIDNAGYYVASAAFGGNTYTDSKKIDYFAGHSLSLKGDIGVNFYLNLSEQEITDGAKVDFVWMVDGKQKTHSVTLTAADKTSCGYKASCPIAVAEMTYEITATLTIGETAVDTDAYSAVTYANVILTDEAFRTKFIAEKGETKYNQLVTLVKTMLDYGSKAQIRFDRDTDHLANGGTDFFTGEVTIPNNASDMEESLSDCGLEYVGTSVIYLSETTLRHYYRIVDPSKFTDEIKNGITFDGETVTYGEKNGMIYFDKKDIATSQLDTEYVISINGHEYRYAALDYSSLAYNSDDTPYEDSITKQLAAAVYRYNQAANEYFAD